MVVVIHEPEPVVVYQEQCYNGQFQYGLFDTCCQCKIHLEISLCWFLRVQSIAEYFGNTGVGWCLLSICFPCCTIALERQKVREMHGINGNLCGDCATSTFACPCALLQLEGEAYGYIKPACGGQCCNGGACCCCGNCDLRRLLCCCLWMNRLNGGVEPM